MKFRTGLVETLIIIFSPLLAILVVFLLVAIWLAVGLTGEREW